ncbi:UvrB/UvrC motif-containing protein [Patescibacteria group bacterium]|nr:UvrB/UvrC motif-containing protein [Patescibacteria group bacterium]
MIPNNVKIKNKELPDCPGVYFFKDSSGTILYIGKATSLKRRVSSYFIGAHNIRLEELVSKIQKIDYIQTQTVIEALVLEANQIKAHQPYYNFLQKDDTSFNYLVISNEEFPRPIIIRGRELEAQGIDPFSSKLSKDAKKHYLAVFGPYTSGHSLKQALDIIRKWIPWSECLPPSASGKSRPCFYRHIHACPGVCTGEISKSEYKKIIRRLMLFFSGERTRLAASMNRQMIAAAKQERFEEAAKLRNVLQALKHIQDIALISKEDIELPFEKIKKSVINLDGRIEGYDISNIQGQKAVGSMVVFTGGRVSKKDYRIFNIKNVKGANDVAMLEEVVRRRLVRARSFPNKWALPDLMVIDGGKPQVNRIQNILNEFGIEVPIVGLAKGPDRKQDRLIFDRIDDDILEIATRGKQLFQMVRDESHRFAVKHHRIRMRKR